MTAHPQHRFQQPIVTLLSLALLALSSLPALGGAKPAATREASPRPAAAPTAVDAGVGQSAERGTSITPDALAERLCATLHTLPEVRKAECCRSAPASSLATECTRTLSAALGNGALRLDADGIDRCAADSSTAFAGCDWVTPLVPPSPPSCQGAALGLAAAGAACTSSLECQDGLFCRGAGSSKGVCAKPASPGAACGGSIDTLATFLRQTELAQRHPECGGYCLAGRCAAFSPSGAACLSSRQCAPGEHCGAGTCQAGAFAALGEACTGTSCGPDASCQQGKCAPRKAAGASCSSPFECKGTCQMAVGATSGTCGMKCSNWPLPPTQGENEPAPKAGAKGDR